MNVAETVARALSVTAVVSADAVDVFRTPLRLPGRGAGRGADGPADGGLPAGLAGRPHRHLRATPTGGREQLWGSV